MALPPPAHWSYVPSSVAHDNLNDWVYFLGDKSLAAFAIDQCKKEGYPAKIIEASEGVLIGIKYPLETAKLLRHAAHMMGITISKMLKMMMEEKMRANTLQETSPATDPAESLNNPFSEPRKE